MLTVFWIVIGLIPSDAVARIASLLMLAYLGWFGLTTLHRVFGESWPRTIVKTVVIAGLYSVCLSAVGLALLGYTISKV